MKYYQEISCPHCKKTNIGKAGVKEKIVEMGINGSGIRDTARALRAGDLITSETITQNFCFRLDALRRRIVILRNDLRAFKLGQKGKLEFGCY